MSTIRPIADIFWFFIFIMGICLILKATKNIFAFVILSYWVMIPTLFYAPSKILQLFALSAFFKGLGALFANYVSRFHPKKELRIFKEKPISNFLISKNILNYTIWICIFTSIIAGIYYFSKVGIALFTEDVGYYRLIYKTGIKGWFVFLRIIRALFPILIMVYFLKIQNNRKLKQYVILVFLILTNALFLMFTGMRANLIIFMFTPALVFSGLFFKKISYKLLVTIFLFALVVAAMTTALMYNTADIFYIANIILTRIAYGAIDGISYIVYGLIPQEGLFHGATYIMDIKSLIYKLGFTTDKIYNFSEYIAKTLMGNKYTNEQAANYLEGELYANWGTLGVMAGGLVAGIILQSIYIKTLRFSKDIVFFPFCVYFQSILVAILGGPVLSMLIDNTISLIFFFTLFIFIYFFFSLPTGKIIIKIPVHKGRN